MRVFVTGASGWIGSATVPELIAAGHQVTGLARSEASADALVAAGAQVVRGTIDDLDVLRKAAAGSDGVIHLAFKHDIMFTGGHEEAGMADRRAIETFGDALAGSDRPFVIASGTGNLAPGRVLTEGDAPESSDGQAGLRMGNARLTVELAERGVRSVVLRLPPTVHGDGDAGFMASVVGTARAKGVSAYVGDGENRWPAVHRVDAAVLFRLALEGAAPGSVLHAVADEGVSIRSVAEVIGRHLELPVTSVSAEDAGEHFGWLGGFLSADVPASGAWTQESMGWVPSRPGLIEDLEKGHYFQS